jgi:hypothetical protein
MNYMNLNYTTFVDFFLYVKNIEHQTLVSFLLLTSIVNISKRIVVSSVSNLLIYYDVETYYSIGNTHMEYLKYLFINVLF